MTRLRKDVDRNVIQIEEAETKIAGLSTDRARVVAGAWVANGLTCLFVGAMMWIGSRAFAAEAQLFKESIVKEVQEATRKK